MLGLIDTFCVQMDVITFFRGHVVVITPLPRDGVTAQTAIQVHAINLIEIR